MQKYDYNIMVIGGGSAGLVSSYMSSALGAKVALIESHKMGGDCLNTGCVPSKALIRSAKVMHLINTASEVGIDVKNIEVNFTQVMQHVHSTIKRIKPHDSRERYTKLGVDCIDGYACIESPHSIKVNDKTYSTRSIIVATGARPKMPDISGIETSNYATSDTVWQLKTLPKKLVVLGGGPIGCELAQAFARLGSQVSIVQGANTLLPKEDADTSKFIQTQFKAEGIEVYTGYKGMKAEANKLICNSINKDMDEKLELSFDLLLIALGREPNITGFGLEKLGIKLNADNTIKTNAYLQTSIANIYACGDVAGPYQFTHMAAHQAWYAAINALLAPIKKFKVNYDIVPWSTFVDPEVARVGLNEKEAQAANIAYQVTTFDISDLDRAIIDNEAKGFIKLLTPPKKDKILGVTIVGTHAGDLLAEFILAMKQGTGLNKILSTIHIYPTLAEANKYVAGAWRKAHTPKWLLGLASKFHTWRRK